MAAAAGVGVEVQVEPVNDALPLPEGFRGSPTFLIDGLDLEPASRGRADAGSS